MDENIKVEKRDGRLVEFNAEKISEAIRKAMKKTLLGIDEELIEKIQTSLANSKLYKGGKLSVEEIQDFIEKELMKSPRKDVAKEYIVCRENRNRIRESKSKLIKEVAKKLKASNVENQNANVDEKSFGGRIGEASRVVTKEYALNNCMSKMARENHLANEIYIHDLDSYAVGSHNCLSIPFDDLLKNGFNTRQVDIRPAGSINTAFQLVAVIFQLQSLQQFGGVSATHLDWTMVPYVRKSFQKHYIAEYLKTLDSFYKFNFETMSGDEIENWVRKEVTLFFENTGLKNEDFKLENKALDFKLYQRAMFETRKELDQSVEGMYHNLNSLQSRSGNQLPFTSINYGTCTLPEGRMVTKALIEGSLKGVGKFHRTSIFPCGIFQCMKGVNRKPGEPNYDLFQLALKSTSLRLYPNYANVDWSGNAGYDINDPRTYFSTMGK